MALDTRDLSGTWAASVADDRLRREYLLDGFDDGGWAQVAIPSHWQRSPGFADADGPLLYRRAFDAERPRPDQRWWLTLEGVFYQSDVWLDGTYLGDTEGYFAGHSFEVTDQLGARDHHTLAVEVTCAPQRDLAHKRNLTGVFQHSDAVDPALNPGGIWRPVRIERSGPARITRHRVICREADRERATIALNASINTTVEREVVVRTTVAGVDHLQPHHLSPGDNEIHWTVVVPRPELWWPHSLGDQPLHELTVEVSCDGAVSDRRRTRVGFRSVRMRDWILRVNGERLFLKGANLGPTSYWLAEAGMDEARRDLDLARGAHLDLVRVRGHIARPELYAAADELGLLVWQDLPLQHGYHRSVRAQAVRQAAAAVDLLGHHPSVAIWCGHNDPDEVPIGSGDSPVRTAVSVGTAVGANQLPSYTRSVLDVAIARELRSADGSRPVIAHSGVAPHLPRLDGTDSHLFVGWRFGDERQFPAMCAAVPRMVRFVSEFGAQSVPIDAPFIDAARWPRLDWDDLRDHHSMQTDLFERHVPPADFAEEADWAAATRAYQATVLRFQVEALRRIKYRPTGGFAWWLLADSLPAVTGSLVSAGRVPKEGYGVLAEVCRPVIPIADRLPHHAHPGDELTVELHVCSDLRTPISGARLEAVWQWDDGIERHRFIGDVGPDAVEFIGRTTVTAPAHTTALTLDLHLTVDGATVTRRDETVIIAGAHAH